jgi:hypothetical protein
VYLATLAVYGGTAPFTWSIISGGLPAGLTLDAATGDIFGTPLQPGLSKFAIRVTDSASPATAAKRTLWIKVR